MDDGIGWSADDMASYAEWMHDEQADLASLEETTMIGWFIAGMAAAIGIDRGVDSAERGVKRAGKKLGKSIRGSDAYRHVDRVMQEQDVEWEDSETESFVGGRGHLFTDGDAKARYDAWKAGEE